MRKTLALALALAIAAVGMPTLAFASGKTSGARQAGSITGTAQNAQKQALPNAQVRVRKKTGGPVLFTTTTDSTGSFTFTGLEAGDYVVEIADATGSVVGLSPAVSVTAGAVAHVTVAATAAGAIGAAAGGGFGLFGLGTAATIGVLGAAGALTTVGIVKATGNNSSATPATTNASPSR